MVRQGAGRGGDRVQGRKVFGRRRFPAFLRRGERFSGKIVRALEVARQSRSLGSPTASRISHPVRDDGSRVLHSFLGLDVQRLGQVVRAPEHFDLSCFDEQRGVAYGTVRLAMRFAGRRRARADERRRHRPRQAHLAHLAQQGPDRPQLVLVRCGVRAELEHRIRVHAAVVPSFQNVHALCDDRGLVAGEIRAEELVVRMAVAALGDGLDLGHVDLDLANVTFHVDVAETVPKAAKGRVRKAIFDAHDLEALRDAVVRRHDGVDRAHEYGASHHIFHRLRGVFFVGVVVGHLLEHARAPLQRRDLALDVSGAGGRRGLEARAELAEDGIGLREELVDGLGGLLPLGVALYAERLQSPRRLGRGRAKFRVQPLALLALPEEGLDAREEFDRFRSQGHGGSFVFC